MCRSSLAHAFSRAAWIVLFALLVAPDVEAQRRRRGQGVRAEGQQQGRRGRESRTQRRRENRPEVDVDAPPPVAPPPSGPPASARLTPDPPLRDPELETLSPSEAVVASRGGPWLPADTLQPERQLLGSLPLSEVEGLTWWRDERDGRPGVYCARLDPSGRQLGTEWELEDPWSAPPMAELDVATTQAGRAVFAWRHEGDREGIWLRYLEGETGWSGPAIRVELPTEEQETPDRVAPIGLRVGIDGAGAGVVCWNRRGRLLARSFEWAAGELSPVENLNGVEVPATGNLLFATGAGGELAGAWPSGAATVLVGIGPEGRTWEARARGVVALERDPVHGGWWVLRKVDDRLVLRRLFPEGRWAEAESAVYQGDWDEIALRAVGRELALLVSLDDPSRAPTHPGAESWAYRFVWVQPDGAPRPQGAVATWIKELAPEGAGQLSVSAERCALVWPERRDGRVQIITRELTRGREGEENGMLAPSNGVSQREQSIVGVAAAHVWLAWTELGVEDSRVQLARFDEAAPPPAHTLPIEGSRLGPCSYPAMAVQRDGRVFVSWVEQVGRKSFLFAQLIGPDGAPLVPAWPVDVDQPVPAVHPPAIVAAPGGRGFLMCWVRLGEADGFNQRELWTRRVSHAGAAVGPAVRVARGTMLRNPAACALGDDFVLAWDEVDGEERRAVRLLTIDRNLRPQQRRPQRVLGTLERDWRPQLASARDGFLLAWNADDEEQSDVFARYFDERLQPAGRLLALTPVAGHQSDPALAPLDDGSHLVAWAADSGNGEVHARRVRRLGARLTGPTVLLSGLEGQDPAPPQRAPAVGALRDGHKILLLWNEAARARGWDLAWGQLGRGFDAVEGRFPQVEGR